MPTYHLSYPLKELQLPPSVLALGCFDGIHRGHHAVLKRTIELAKRHACVPGVLTFHPHPSEVLKEIPIKEYLTPYEEKIRQLEKAGIRHVLIMKFDACFSKVTKEEFVQSLLPRLSVRGVVTGDNFRFGRNASGTSEDLKRLSQGFFTVETLSIQSIKEKVFSSTKIRELLDAGNVTEVKALLGRPYAVEGKVVPGDKRGRLMGFPTANIHTSESFMLPRYGVYVVQVTINEENQAFGLINIGVRPTINKHNIPRLEVHLFDWSEDIYGAHLRIELLHFLREEEKFSSLELLIDQIKDDVHRARSCLAGFAMI